MAGLVAAKNLVYIIPTLDRPAAGAAMLRLRHIPTYFQRDY